MNIRVFGPSNRIIWGVLGSVGLALILSPEEGRARTFKPYGPLVYGCEASRLRFIT